MIFDCVVVVPGLLLWRVIIDALLLIVCLMRLYLYYSGFSGPPEMGWVREPLKSDWAGPCDSMTELTEEAVTAKTKSIAEWSGHCSRGPYTSCAGNNNMYLR